LSNYRGSGDRSRELASVANVTKYCPVMALVQKEERGLPAAFCRFLLLTVLENNGGVEDEFSQ
jgi:hypothetical protein